MLKGVAFEDDNGTLKAGLPWGQAPDLRLLVVPGQRSVTIITIVASPSRGGLGFRGGGMIHMQRPLEFLEHEKVQA